MCRPSNVDMRPSKTIWSTTSPFPSRYPKRAFGRRYGAFDIDSIPPVTTSSCPPARIIRSAISRARIEDAQTLLIVSAGISLGTPAPTAACRAGAWPTPAWSTCPMMPYSTSCGSRPARASASRIAIDPSSVAGYPASPPPSRPNGVRTAATMTDRDTESAYRPSRPGRRHAGTLAGMRVLVVDNYDSFTYNLVHLLEELGADVVVRRSDAVTVEEAHALAPDRLVVSPGPGRPAGAGRSVELIVELGGRMPTLGVCLGHQAIVEAFGGEIGPARSLLHGKASRIVHDGRGIYTGLPQELVAGRYHS